MNSLYELHLAHHQIPLTLTVSQCDKAQAIGMYVKHANTYCNGQTAPITLKCSGEFLERYGTY